MVVLPLFLSMVTVDMNGSVTRVFANENCRYMNGIVTSVSTNGSCRYMNGRVTSVSVNGNCRCMNSSTTLSVSIHSMSIYFSLTVYPILAALCKIVSPVSLQTLSFLTSGK